MKRIIDEKFVNPIFGLDKNAAKFVDLLSKETLKIKTEIYKLVSVNFFYQQDSNKQTTFHNIAASKEKCDNLLKKVFEDRSDREKGKLRNILTKMYNGKSKISAKINPDKQLEEFAKIKNVPVPNYSYPTLRVKEIPNEQNPEQKSTIIDFCECTCEFKKETFTGKGNKKNEAKQNAAEKALIKHKLSYKARSTKNKEAIQQESQTPLDVAIEFENFEFISKYQMFWYI